jgi:hypothetical protein
MTPPFVLELGREFFASHQRAFVVWARTGPDDDLETLCRERGWFERPPEDGMPLILREGHFPAGPADVPSPTVVEARTDAEEYLSIVAAAYGMADAPCAIQKGVFFPVDSVLSDSATLVIVDHDGRPASGSTVVMNGGHACSLWTATAPFARDNRLGPECGRKACNVASERGARLVAAQSSQMGLAAWIKLGFDVVGSYRRFLSPPAHRLGAMHADPKGA